MENYKEIYSTTNPVEFDRLVMLLENQGMDIQTKGRQALNVGNVELTGISGASLLVHSSQVSEAGKLLESTGIVMSEGDTGKASFNRIYKLLAMLLIAVLVYMIWTALK